MDQHIGMSNVRESVIKQLGEAADDAGLVGRGWQLPKSWPADSSGTNSIWPDRATAGRQIFRVLYSIVSGVTLSSACTAFAQVGQSLQLLPTPDSWCPIFFAVAVLSNACSIASLGNPSPLSLVPRFTQNSTAASQAGMLRVDRDDSLKLRPYGLTRITRHPLVLPVVPWGLANGLVAGGRAQALLLFWGLAAYAVCGCYAQDLRAQRSDAVGTVFEEGLLGDFYKSTSFFPALAIADGRQDLRSTLMELSGLSPWFLGGLAAGCLTEASLISLVQSL